MDLWTLGKKPIRPEHPAGADVRYDPEFEELQAEIDKLSTPSATGGTDWEKVDRLAAGILASKSKDLLVASYFAVAAIRTRRLEGFAQGLQIYLDLLQSFWDELFPPKKRMRGRAAAVEWWIEKSEAALQSMTIEPASAETLETCRLQLNRLDEMLQAKLESPPLTRPLERVLDGIPVQSGGSKETETAPPGEEAQTPAESRASATVSPGEAAETAAPEPETPRRAAPPPVEKAQAAETRSGPAEAPSGATQDRAPRESPTGAGWENLRPTSSPEAERVLRSAFQVVRRTADYYLEENLADPRSYRLRRIAGWSLIHALPPAANSRTEIPPPINGETVRSELQALKAKGNGESLVRAAEERFHSAVLWLDLNRFSAEGLAALGPSYEAARDAITHDVVSLLERLPGIETLSFSDGTPCADGATRKWLEAIRPKAQAGATAAARAPETQADRPEPALLDQARELAGRSRLREAVDVLGRALRGSPSHRERMLWRLALCEILLEVSGVAPVLPQLQVILQDVDSYRLETWDPDLALRGLKLVWQGFNAASADTLRTQATDILSRIAKLDPAEALALAGR